MAAILMVIAIPGVLFADVITPLTYMTLPLLPFIIFVETVVLLL